MSSAREEILGRVRDALADVPRDEPAGEPPPVGYEVASGLSPPAAVGRFAERVSEYRAEVRRAEPSEVGVAVAAALADHGARRIAIPAGLPAEWRPDGVELIEDSTALGSDELDRLDGALTGCAAAIAETGTIVLDSGPDQGRRALTLVPDLHVCVVPAERIVGSVPEAIRSLEGRLDERPPLTLISGPSATSDIELNRVEGVHGPRRLEVVVAG